MKTFILKLFSITALLLTAPAFANFNDMMDRLEAEVGVELPVYVGGHAKFSVNKNFYTRLGMGFASGLLLKGLNWYGPKLGLIDSLESPLVVDAISDSFYLEIRLGYRPRRHKGFYFEGGWSLMTGEGETSFQTLNQAISRNGLTAESNPQLALSSMVHNATAHIGYMFPLLEDFGISTELGLIKPVYSDSRIIYDKEMKNESEEDSQKLNDIITQKVWFFTGSVWIYYMF